jgi:hypothetical protein
MQTTMHSMTSRILLGAAGLALAATLAGCGDVEGTNNELTAIHMTGPNCTQSACHAGFTLSGTLYEQIDGAMRLPGETLWVIPPSGPEVGIVADDQANVWALGTYQGDYLFRIGQTTSAVHAMPDRAACNTCHVPLGTSGIATGRMFRDP